MKKNILASLLTLLFATFLHSQTVYDNYIDGRVYVRINKSALKKIANQNPNSISLNKLEQFETLFKKYGVSKALKPFHRAWEDELLTSVLKLEFTKINQVENLINDLSKHPDVLYAEKVSLSKIDAVPNDALYSGLSHLTQINAPNAWNVFNSTANGTSSITVAIVDNAVMWTHADLVANTYTNTGEIAGNSVDDDNNGYVDDVNGFDVSDLDNNPIPTNLSMNHGTHCAGIAGASTDNSIGVSAIGWNIKIIPVKCQPDGGSTVGVLNGYEGIIYAVRARARIISCSWGNTISSSITEQAVINFAWNRGCIVIASAGNNGNTSPNYPGAYNNVYCVAAVDNGDVKWSGSSYGSWIDISAPGVNINSTVPYTPSATPAYLQQTGTSMSTPLVAGLAALMLSRSPNMTRTNVLNCISSTAVNIYTLSGNSSFSGSLGAGRIDAFAAMNCAATFSATAPVANFFAFPLLTCPGASVSLFDSSLYVPTSWSWVIQGGTPATSTLANPVVQWSSPGIYSISLTVSNANGSSSFTKLSYVTISGPQSLPFFEGFQSTPFLPANWSQRNIGNDAIFWERRTGLGGFGTSTACAMFDNFTYQVANDRDEMRTPRFNFGNVAMARLRFDVAYARFDATFSDTLEVRLSTNCGSTWTSIYIKGGTTLATAPDAAAQFTPTSIQWRRDTIDVSIPTFGQNNVLFSFVNRGRFGQPIYLDNINIVTPTPTLSLLGTNTVCNGSTISFSNPITGAYAYTWTAPGSSVPTSTLINPSFNFTTNGTYSINLFAINGTSTANAVYTVNVVNTPTLTVSSTASLCSGNTLVLNAGGAASSYSWNGVAGNSSLSISPSVSTTYTLMASNGGTCGSTQVVTVNVTSSPTLSVFNQTICTGGSATLIASGANSYSWNTGATSSAIVVSPTALTVYTVNGINGACVDTKTVSVATGASLSIQANITPSIVCVGTTVNITASGANSYTWSNSSNSNSILVTPSVTTSYTVSGNSGSCFGNTIITVSVTASPAPTLSIKNADCTGNCTGELNATTLGGSAPFTYSLSGSTCSAVPCTGLCPGSYTLKVFNAQGCSSGTTFSVSLFANTMAVSITTVNALCAICADGSLNAGVSGGTPPITYTWLPSGGNSAQATNLLPGCYTLTATDASNCTITAIGCVDSDTGLENASGNNKGIFVYPNPAKEKVIISVVNSVFDLNLYNSLGQLVYSKQLIKETLEINTLPFSKGVYLLKLKHGDLFYTQKLILE